MVINDNDLSSLYPEKSRATAKVPPSIMVHRSDGTVTRWSIDYITRSIINETEQAERELGIPRIIESQASKIARSVEKKVFGMYRDRADVGEEDDGITIPASLVRELVGNEFFLLSKKDIMYEKYRQINSRVGIPFIDGWNNMWLNRLIDQNENANQGAKNPENIHKKFGDVMSQQIMEIALPPELARAEAYGDIHLHQLEYSQRPFCEDYDLRYFFLNGLLADGSGDFSAAAKPAKYAATAISHAVKVLAAGQCNSQGGQGLFNFNIFIAPYLRGMSYIDIKQMAQMFIYDLNETYVSRGGQFVFSSIQIEPTVPKIWQDAPVVYRGKIHGDLHYGDFEKEAQLFAKALLENYLEGDENGKMFFFPKPEIKIRKEHFSDAEASEIIRMAIELSAKYGSSYFDSVVPGYRDSEGQDCYQCCAYHFSEDKETLMPKIYYENGHHFSMSGQQVVTINHPRLGYLAKGDFSKFSELLRDRMYLAASYLAWKRQKVINFANAGNLPFLTQRPRGNKSHPSLCDIDGASSIIGFIGMNEFVQAMTGYELHESELAVRLGVRALLEMEAIRKELVAKYNIPFAIARTPAESTAQRFAVKDLLRFNGEASKYVKGDVTNWKKRYHDLGKTGVPVYYTNGFMVNHGAPVSLDQKISIEQKAFPRLSGGNICHFWLGERYPDIDALFDLNKRIALKSQIGYWSYTTDLTSCKSCGFHSRGLKQECDFCHETDLEHYSRITGYYQAVSGWNAAKLQELHDRHRYDVS